MLPAYKLPNIDLPPLKIQITGVRREYKVDSKGLVYYNLDDQTKSTLLELFIPEKCRRDFDVVLMHIFSDNVLPHIDSDTQTVVNLYLCPEDGITYFYDVINDEPIKINGQTDGVVYDEKNLREIFSFQAGLMERWILNVKKVHSVKHPENKFMNRLAYSFVTEIPFNDVINHFLI